MRSARLRTAKLTALVTGLVVAISSCASNAPQDSLDPAGPAARKIDNLIMPVFGIAGVVFLFVMVGAVYVALRFKAKDDTDFNEFPEQVHGNFKLEIGWTIAPALVLLVVGAFTITTIFDLAAKPGDDAIQVEVYGQQWWWEYRYDVDGDGDFTDIITANDLVIPAGREIALNIKSRDVIHSWWAPRLHGKKDAVPGRVHPLTIEADEPGEYFGQCTEFCGLSHAEMRVKVIALSQQDYDAWVEKMQQPFEEPADEQADAGWRAFVGQCTMCHEIQGMPDPEEPGSDFEFPLEKDQVANAAPDLTKLMTRTTFAGAMFDLRNDTDECRALGLDWASTEEGVDECLNRADLEAWLRDSPGQKFMHAGDVPSPDSRGMPDMGLTEEQIDDFIAFFLTLQ